MHSFSTEGIILKRVDFGEADKLLTIFTKNKGKITSLAKGIRRIESRRSGNVDLLNHSKLFFAQGRSLPILTEAESISTFKELKKDLNKISLAYHLTELIDQFFHDQQENYKVFELLFESLTLLNLVSKEKAENIIRAFEIKILTLSGYSPELFNCVKCSKKLEPNGNVLSPDSGGVLHSAHAQESLQIKSISSEAIKILRFMKEKTLSDTIKLNIPETTKKELKEMMKYYMEFILEKELYSAKFSEEVNNLK